MRGASSTAAAPPYRGDDHLKIDNLDRKTTSQAAEKPLSHRVARCEKKQTNLAHTHTHRDIRTRTAEEIGFG